MRIDTYTAILAALTWLVSSTLAAEASVPGLWRHEQYTGAVIEDQIGGLHLRHKGRWIKPGEMLSSSFRSPRAPYALFVRIIVPDDLPGHHISYAVDINGCTLGKRELKTEGVGRRSQFIRVTDSGIYEKDAQEVLISNTSKEALFLESLTMLTGYVEALRRPLPPDDFTLSFLIHNGDVDHSSLERIRSFYPGPGVRFALSTELRYAQANRERVLEEARNLAMAADAARLPVVPALVSWWSGTPREVFDRIDFQQVCYSRTDTLDEGQPLKDLLGERWKIEYGLTVPNVWSSTPWQTMNHPELNQIRKARLDEAMPRIVEIVGDSAIGFITENEPMYWAGAFPDGRYPVAREDLLADFNPHTVAAAASDGVKLEPENGLGLAERFWLHRNLNTYLARTAGWIAAHASPVPVYTHALLEDHFPMKGSGHARPAMEAAVAPPLPTGVEMLWDTSLDKLLRLREWGEWAVVNREENDGREINQHIAMLVASYAMGARMLNSYNWQAIMPQERCERYFNGFADRLPRHVVCGDDEDRKPSGWSSVGRIAWKAGADPAAPWGTTLRLRLKNTASSVAEARVTVRGDSEGTIAGYSRIVLPPSSDGWFEMEMENISDASQHQDLIFEFRSDQAVQIAMASGRRPLFQWIFKVAEERRRSQMLAGI